MDAMRRALAALGRGRTTRIPDALRARLLGAARRERARGASWRVIAQRLGVSRNSLRNWQRGGERPPALVRVRVAASERQLAKAEPALVVVSPRGYRVLGGDVATVAAVLRALE